MAFLCPRRFCNAYEVLVVLPLAVYVEARVRRVPLPRLAARLGVRLAVTESAPEPSFRLRNRDVRRLKAVAWIFKYWPDADSCLRRALVAGCRLRHLDPRLHLGVRRDARGRVEAHAWLEVQGHVWDPEADTYGRLSNGSGPSSR